MPTVIGLSFHRGDTILVAENIEEIRGWILPNARSTNSPCRLTRIPKKDEADFEPFPISLGPVQIAYVDTATES